MRDLAHPQMAALKGEGEVARAVGRPAPERTAERDYAPADRFISSAMRSRSSTEPNSTTMRPFR